MKITSVIIGFFALIPVCTSAPFPKNPEGKRTNNHKIVVAEVLQTTSYTYLKVNENDSLKWLAIPSMQARVGETYYYSEGLPMKQFESKELHRTFDEVLFLGGVSPEPLTGDKPKAATANAQPYARKANPEVKKDIKIDAQKDCITIGALFSQKESYAGKTVKIKGQVTKYNAEIMNKNWIHIQDGTESNGKFDLVITSPDNVKVGDVVILEGKISLNKDFGYGYLFDVIMEDAVVK